MLKCSSERCVCAPQSLSAGTSTFPRLSVSTRVVSAAGSPAKTAGPPIKTGEAAVAPSPAMAAVNFRASRRVISSIMVSCPEECSRRRLGHGTRPARFHGSAPTPHAPTFPLHGCGRPPTLSDQVGRREPDIRGRPCDSPLGRAGYFLGCLNGLLSARMCKPEIQYGSLPTCHRGAERADHPVAQLVHPSAR